MTNKSFVNIMALVAKFNVDTFLLHVKFSVESLKSAVLFCLQISDFYVPFGFPFREIGNQCGIVLTHPNGNCTIYSILLFDLSDLFSTELRRILLSIAMPMSLFIQIKLTCKNQYLYHAIY